MNKRPWPLLPRPTSSPAAQVGKSFRRRRGGEAGLELGSDFFMVGVCGGRGRGGGGGGCPPADSSACAAACIYMHSLEPSAWAPLARSHEQHITGHCSSAAVELLA